MKRFIVFSVMGLGLSCFAQPVITSSITPTIGQSFQFMDFDSTKHEPGGSGPGQVWDFSKIDLYDTVTLAFLEPKNTPYGYMFPGANMAMTSDKIEYNYFNFSAADYRVIGDMGVDPTYQRFSITTYSKPEIMLEFPVEYGNKFSGVNDRIVDYPGEVMIYQHNTSSYEADAWGTLILPFGKFENALRIRRNDLYEDSMTNGKRFLLQTQVETRYQWFIPGVAAPVLTIGKTLVGDNKGRDTMYDNTVAVLLKEKLLENKTLFPLYLSVRSSGAEKAEIVFQLSQKEKVRIQILDNAGKEVLQYPEEVRPAGVNHVDLDAGKLSSGIYLITVSTKNSRESVPWIRR